MRGYDGAGGGAGTPSTDTARGAAFIDGNKRIGHAAIEVFLVLNGFELLASVDEQEQRILAVASGALTREVFVEWLATRMRPVDEPA